MTTDRTYIIAARRSPTGKFLGGLSKLPATAIGAQVARAVLADAALDPAEIDDVLVGQVLQAGAGQNPARQVALAAGVPDEISACTINKVCGSGLQTVMFADQAIRAGDAHVVLAGGIESMSQAPFLLRDVRMGRKYGDAAMIDSMNHDGLLNIYDGDLMGVIAEETAEAHGVSRQAQDAFSARSHQRAAAADAEGRFDAERVPIEVRPGKSPFATDETIRPTATPEALAMLAPVFKPGGTVTAGNASPLSDGAAMVLAVSERGLSQAKAPPLGRIVAQVTVGAHPRQLFLTPIEASRRVCRKAGWPLDSVDLWELNEAFASEMVAVVRGLDLDESKVNVHGGAIALGHPLGASGARVLVTLLHAMKHRQARRGTVAMCLGGGHAVAMAIEAA